MQQHDEWVAIQTEHLLASSEKAATGLTVVSDNLAMLATDQGEFYAKARAF